MTWDDLTEEERESIVAEAGQLGEDAEKVRRYEALADMMEKADRRNRAIMEGDMATYHELTEEMFGDV